MKKGILLLMLPVFLSAQPKKDDRKLVALEINYAPDKTSDKMEYFLLADKPACVQLKPNQTFLVQNAYRQGDKVRQIAQGTVSGINPTIVEMNCKATKAVQKGDMVMFLVPLKNPGKDSLFFKMARLDIRFKTVTDSVFYDRDSMLSNPAFYPTANLLSAMAADINYTASQMLLQNDNQDQDIMDGKYRGKKLFGMMQVVTSNDVELFMKYVYKRPEKYMVHDWKVSETLATWVVNGAPGL